MNAKENSISLPLPLSDRWIFMTGLAFRVGPAGNQEKKKNALGKQGPKCVTPGEFSGGYSFP